MCCKLREFFEKFLKFFSFPYINQIIQKSVKTYLYLFYDFKISDLIHFISIYRPGID